MDFEFRLLDSLVTLQDEEMFCGGKLVPSQIASIRPFACIPSESGPITFPPKAPRCSNRWKELLAFKRFPVPKDDNKNPRAKSLKKFIHRNPKSARTDPSVNLPLLQDSDTNVDILSVSESESISAKPSRLSISLPTSSPDHEDIPCLSLDSKKSNLNSTQTPNPPKVRVLRAGVRSDPAGRITKGSVRRPVDPNAVPTIGSSADSPRMTASGKIIIPGLEQSSPSNSGDGSRVGKNRGPEKSYSANVGISPVLNVPVYSFRTVSKVSPVFEFGQLFSQQKREGSKAKGYNRLKTI